MPGSSIRQGRWTPLDPALSGHLAFSLDRPRLPCHHAAPADRTAANLRSWKICIRRCGRRRPVAGLRTQLGETRRSFPAQRRLFHHEWSHFGSLRSLRSRRLAISKIENSRRDSRLGCPPSEAKNLHNSVGEKLSVLVTLFQSK